MRIFKRGFKEKKRNLISEIRNHPENYKLEVWIEGDEVIAKIRKK